MHTSTASLISIPSQCPYTVPYAKRVVRLGCVLCKRPRGKAWYYGLVRVMKGPTLAVKPDIMMEKVCNDDNESFSSVMMILRIIRMNILIRKDFRGSFNICVNITIIHLVCNIREKGAECSEKEQFEPRMYAPAKC